MTTMLAAWKCHSTRQNRRFLLLSYTLVFSCRRTLAAGKACHVMFRILACKLVKPQLSRQYPLGSMLCTLPARGADNQLVVHAKLGARIPCLET